MISKRSNNMEYRTVFAGVILATILINVESVCPPETFNATATFSLPEDATAGDSCVFTITRPSATKFTTLKLQHVVMAMGTNDALTVYDGESDPANVVMQVNGGNTVLFQVLITFSEKTTIQYDVTTNKTTSSGDFLFNLEECKHTLTDNWVLPVTSPVYLNNKEDFNCTYTVINDIPPDRMAVVSFTEYNLLGNSYMNITSGSKGANFTQAATSLPIDFFSDPNANMTVIKFKVAKNTESQKFSLTFDASVNSCTKDIAITNKTVMTLELPENPGAGYSCRMRVSVVSGTVSLYVHDASLVEQRDGLTVVEGKASNGKVLSLLTNPNQGHLVLSSGNSVSLHLWLSSVKSKRSITLVFKPQAFGGRLVGVGTLDAKPVVEKINSTCYQLLAAPGHVVSVALGSVLKGNTSLAFFNGLDVNGQLVANLTSKHQTLRTVVGGPAMLVELTDLPVNSSVKAEFTSVLEGCNRLETSESAQLAYKESVVNASETCQWTLAPSINSGAMVLHLDAVTLGDGDSVTVYSGVDNTSTTLATFSNLTNIGPLPEIIVPVQSQARVVIKRSDMYHADMMVSMHYTVVPLVCGGPLTAGNGNLTTPNFPNQYPLNSDCVWSRPGNQTKLLLLSFKSLSLATDHSINVVQVGKNSSTTLATYGGRAISDAQLPVDFIGPSDKMTQIHFSSVPSKATTGVALNQVGMGAQLQYWYLDCGGNVSKVNGSISSPGYPQKPTKDAACVWVITLQGNSSKNIVGFNITANGTQAKNISKYLTIHDGASLRAPMMPVTFANNTASALSRYNSIVVIYNYTYIATKADDVGFNLTFVTHKCNLTCANGVCMHDDWICNNIDDCGDNSDEKNCTGPGPRPTPPPTPTPAPVVQDYSGYVKSGWVPASLFIGILLGAALLLLVPKIIRRFRGGGSSSYSRMNDNTPVVA